MPADRNYDDDCQLPSCHLPQDRSTWLIRYGLHLGPKQWAAWRGPSNYHVWPPTAQLSGGDDQRWLGTRFLTGPQDFQSLGASVCFPMFLLYSNKYSKKPLFSTTPIQFIQWTTLPSLSRRWFSLNNYCACNKWFVWLCCNCLCECMLSRKKEDAKKFWLCIGQHMWISDREVHVFKMLCVYVCAWNLKCVDDVLCVQVSWARLRGGIFCWPYQPCCTKLLNTLYKNVFSFVFYFFAPLDLCVVIYNSLYWNKIMTNVIYFVAAVTVILCERQMHFFLTHNHAFSLYIKTTSLHLTTSATSKQSLSWKWLYLLEYDLSMNAVPQLTILLSVWPTDWRHLCFDHKAHEWMFENLLGPLSVSKYLVRVWVSARVCACLHKVWSCAR